MENLNRTIEEMTRYASGPVGECLSSSSFSDGEEAPERIVGSDVPSVMNEQSLVEFVKENRLKEICYFVPTP